MWNLVLYSKLRTNVLQRYILFVWGMIYFEQLENCFAWKIGDTMSKKKNQITLRSSAAEYLTYIASTGDTVESIEIRYEDENIWLTQKMLSVL